MSIGVNGINNLTNQTGSLTSNKATKSGSCAYAEQKKFEYLLESMSGSEFACAYRNGMIDRNTFDAFVAWSVEQTSHKIKTFDEVRSIFESFFVMEFDPAPFSGRTFNALTGSNTLTIRNGSRVDLGNGYSVVLMDCIRNSGTMADIFSTRT